MISQLIFKPEDIFPSRLHIEDDEGNDIGNYHSLILSSYYGTEIENYRFSIEEFLCYYFGQQLNKIEIYDYDPVKRKISFTNNSNHTDWEINFLYSIVLKSILKGKDITTRQFKCLQKMKYDDSKYKVEISKDNLSRSLRITTVKKNEIKFLANNVIGIRYEYDTQLISLINGLFNNNAPWNPKLEMNIIDLDLVLPFQLDLLEKNGFKIDKIIYDLISLRDIDFFEVKDKDEYITILDNNGFTSSLMKTLVVTGNIT